MCARLSILPARTSSSSSSSPTIQLLNGLKECLSIRHPTQSQCRRRDKLHADLLRDHGPRLVEILNSNLENKEFVDKILRERTSITDLRILLQNLDPSQRSPVQRILSNRLSASAAVKGFNQKWGDHSKLAEISSDGHSFRRQTNFLHSRQTPNISSGEKTAQERVENIRGSFFTRGAERIASLIGLCRRIIRAISGLSLS